MRPFIFILTALIATASSFSPLAVAQGSKSKYPDEGDIAKIFESINEGDFMTFFHHVAPNVSWTMMGTHPLAGEYHNITIFAVDALERLNQTMDPSQKTSMKLVSVVGGGDSEWSVQELHGTGIAKNGKYYNPLAVH
jgi:ketosteroid isomerase-like protein